ncbi:MAG: hypothetical protein NTZ74_06540 [Chloroflexi bacterium]|nr:hypothetical protein [Chloroflexota bacterium]
MKTNKYFDEVPFAITICNKEGVILDMNDKSILAFSKDGGSNLINSSLFDCHTEQSKNILLNMMDSQKINVYTTEKNGQKN